MQRRAQTEDDAALHLRGHDRRVDGHAAVDRAAHASDSQRVVAADLDFGDLRDDGVEGFGERDRLGYAGNLSLTFVERNPFTCARHVFQSR